jgi:glutathionyl-hydroquinone reductase
MIHSMNFNVGLNYFVFAAKNLKMTNMSEKERIWTLVSMKCPLSARCFIIICQKMKLLDSMIRAMERNFNKILGEGLHG